MSPVVGRCAGNERYVISSSRSVSKFRFNADDARDMSMSAVDDLLLAASFSSGWFWDVSMRLTLVRRVRRHPFPRSPPRSG